MSKRSRIARRDHTTKREIVKTIAEQIHLPKMKTREIVQKTFDAIVEALVADGRIELRNFGVFEVKRRAARRARNPKTGDRIRVPARMVVTFRPGKMMEDRVQEMDTDHEELRRRVQRWHLDDGGR